MPRPKKCRRVSCPPRRVSFRSSPSFQLEDVQDKKLEDVAVEILTLDEYEALRLSDYEGLDQTKAAELMEISRPTFTRLIEIARRKIVTFLIEGSRLEIEGGRVQFRENLFVCRNCGREILVPIDQSLESCPTCGSSELDNYAAHYSRGSCCGRRKK